jgi:hypothetical protein
MSGYQGNGNDKLCFKNVTQCFLKSVLLIVNACKTRPPLLPVNGGNANMPNAYYR